MVNIQQKQHAVRRVQNLAERFGITVASVDRANAIVILHHQGLECRVNAIRGTDGYCKTRWVPLSETPDDARRWSVHASTPVFGAAQVRSLASTELLMRHLEQQLEWLQKYPFSLPQAA